MFGFKRDKQNESKTANARLAKKILGKESGRRVFGFACSPDIPARLKMLAGQLNVPIFALAEHSLQLSTGVIAKVAEDPEECELLRQHILDDHVARRTIEKACRYDEEMGDYLYEEIHRGFEIDKVVRQIVDRFVRRGMKPRYIAFYLEYGYRCFVAVMSGRPVPKPQDEMFSWQSQPSDNQPTEEKEDKANDESSKQSG